MSQSLQQPESFASFQSPLGLTAISNSVPVGSSACPNQGTGALATPYISRISAPYRPILDIDPEYSRLPIAAGFNWDDAFAAVDHGEWYLVVFRSQHRADADDAYLTWLDERASRAASRYGGFMYYFIGTPRADGHCLSFCLWRSRQDALSAAADPEHREAMVKGLPFFAHYVLERHRVVKRDGRLAFLPLPRSIAPPALAVPESHDPRSGSGVGPVSDKCR